MATIRLLFLSSLLFINTPVFAQSVSNPYLQQSGPQLLKSAGLSLGRFLMKCDSGVLAAVGVSVGTLIPVVSMFTTNEFGDLSEDEQTELFDTRHWGIIAVPMNLISTLALTTVSEIQTAIDYLEHGKVKREMTQDDFISYQGSFTIFRSMKNSFISLAGEDSACGQEAATLKLINEAIDERIRASKKP